MDKTELKIKSFTPKPIVKLLPGLKGILSKESMSKILLSKIRHSPPKSAIKMRPMTIAELRPHLTGILSKEAMYALSKIHYKPPKSAIKMRPMTLAELSPHLTGILSKEAMYALSKIHYKPPKSAIKMRPMTIAELRPHLTAFTPDTVNQSQSVNNPVKKPRWNSSSKIEDNVSYAAYRQLKKDSVRRVLNYQPKPKTTTQATGSRLAIITKTTKTTKET